MDAASIIFHNKNLKKFKKKYTDFIPAVTSEVPAKIFDDSDSSESENQEEVTDFIEAVTRNLPEQIFADDSIPPSFRVQDQQIRRGRRGTPRGNIRMIGREPGRGPGRMRGGPRIRAEFGPGGPQQLYKAHSYAPAGWARGAYQPRPNQPAPTGVPVTLSDPDAGQADHAWVDYRYLGMFREAEMIEREPRYHQSAEMIEKHQDGQAGNPVSTPTVPLFSAGITPQVTSGATQPGPAVTPSAQQQPAPYPGYKNAAVYDAQQQFPVAKPQ